MSERRLWNWLRKRTFDGYKFRRQFPVDRFVVDFYCPQLRLAIEVDGNHHHDLHAAEAEDTRTARLSSLGITVHRVPNRLLATNSPLVEEQIHFWITRRAAELA